MTRIPLISVLAVAVVGAAGVWLAMPGDTARHSTLLAPAPAASPLSMAANAQDAAEIDTSTVIEMAIGAEDAPVTVIEYASFTCPHCRTFHKNVFPEIVANYVDTGQVRFVHREVYFDRYGLWAGMVARCGGEERYFGMVDMIYDQQGEWSQGEATDVVEALRRIGRTAGLTNEQLDACLSDGTKAQTLVAWYQENAEADDINSTPSFVIDGRKYSNMPYADFAELLDGMIDS